MTGIDTSDEAVERLIVLLPDDINQHDDYKRRKTYAELKSERRRAAVLLRALLAEREALVHDIGEYQKITSELEEKIDAAYRKGMEDAMNQVREHIANEWHVLVADMGLTPGSIIEKSFGRLFDAVAIRKVIP